MIPESSRKGLRLSLNILLDSCHSGKGLEAAKHAVESHDDVILMYLCLVMYVKVWVMPPTPHPLPLWARHI